MTIVATADTRNSTWASDSSSFGRKMLAKMGWKGGDAGLGKNQQGTSTHLRAVRRAESLGIGAESDSFGEKGWQDTNAGFHGVLASLKREYSAVASSGSGESGGEEDGAARKRRRKDEKRRKKKEEKRRANSNGNSSGSEGNGNGVRLPQNKVQAGHARKMREAKDIRNKSAEDMAAIFGVKADFYKRPRERSDNGKDNADPSSDGSSGREKKTRKAKKKKSKENRDEDDIGDVKSKKEKKKRRGSNGGGDDSNGRKKSREDKSKK